MIGLQVRPKSRSQSCESWFEEYLYASNRHATITILPNTQQKQLRAVLNEADLCQYFPESSAWEVRVDVVGIVQRKAGIHLAFVELKATPISLADVGQLLGYCRVCRPREAFLLSSRGLSADLTRLLSVYGRLDVLDFGGKTMQLGRWETRRNEPDWSSLIPGGLLPSI